MRALYIFFFFQAEDGIRDYKVTGVQTCALPISGIGLQQPHDVLQGHALAGARVPDDDHRLLVRHRERDAGEYELRAEALLEILELDHRSSTSAQNASSTSNSTAE